MSSMQYTRRIPDQTKDTSMARTAVGLTLILMSGGCIPIVETTVAAPASPSGEAQNSVERKLSPADVSTSVKGDILIVKVEQRAECRTITSTPMKQDVQIKRNLDPKNGTTMQLGLLGLTGLLAGAGGFAYATAGVCVGDKDPNTGTTKACTVAEEQSAKDSKGSVQTAGIVLASSAIVPLGFFVANIIRTNGVKNETKTLEPIIVREENWRNCETTPLRNVQIKLQLSPVKMGEQTILTAATNGDGEARIDFSRSRSSSDDATLEVDVPQKKKLIVSLTGTPMRLASQAEEAHAHTMKAVVTLERTLSQFNKPKWSEDELALFETVYQLVEQITKGKDTLSQAELTRLKEALTKAAALEPGYKRAAAEANEKNAQTALKLGRIVILSSIRTPSTAQFVSDTILLSCPSGDFLTSHTVDMQNIFGARVRNEMCSRVNVKTKHAAMVRNAQGNTVFDTTCDYFLPLKCENIKVGRFSLLLPF